METFNTLFVDDTEGDNNYIRLLIDIQKLPIDAHFEPTGKNALDYLDNLSKDDFPKIIFVDINMPLMDGFEFIEAFEQKFYPAHKNTMLFIMSSSHRLSEIEKAKSISSIVDFIQKPLTKDVFIEKIMKNYYSNEKSE